MRELERNKLLVTSFFMLNQDILPVAIDGLFIQTIPQTFFCWVFCYKQSTLINRDNIYCLDSVLLGSILDIGPVVFWLSLYRSFKVVFTIFWRKSFFKNGYKKGV